MMKKDKPLSSRTTGWTDEWSLDDSLQVLRSLSIRHALRGGPIGIQIAELIKQGDWASIIGFDLHLTSFDWPVQWLIECRQALGFFQKLEPLPYESEKELVAYNAFLLADLQCRSSNNKFRTLASGLSGEFSPGVVLALFRARRKIAKVLGPCPKVGDLDLRFGPGSTTSITKRKANPQQKLAETPQCSELLLRSGFLPSLLRAMPGWLECHYDGLPWIDEEGFETAYVPVVISPGRLEFVPKNAKTYRPIIVQQTLNTLLQRGLGIWLEKALRRAGIDITDQSKNQMMARLGSLNDDLATLDLQSASDTICKELVKFLLPEAWYALLRAAGCGVVVFGDQTIQLEQFSSMGNGYTFPLQTLLFWALTASVCEDQVSSVSVYGDDIICPSNRVREVVEVLEECGFTVNRLKSYVAGPFRESCGADYYLGIDTRPYYQKTAVSCETLFTLHNFYMRNHNIDDALEVEALIPEPLRLYGPDGYGDGHLISRDWGGRIQREFRRKGYCGVFFDTFQRAPAKVPNLWPGDYVTPLYSIYVKGDAIDPDVFRPMKPVNLPTSQESLDKDLVATEPLEKGKDGRVLWPLPGSEGYRKVSIYTFAR